MLNEGGGMELRLTHGLPGVGLSRVSSSERCMITNVMAIPVKPQIYHPSYVPDGIRSPRPGSVRRILVCVFVLHTSSPQTKGSRWIDQNWKTMGALALIAYFPPASVVSSREITERAGAGGVRRSVSRMTAERVDILVQHPWCNKKRTVVTIEIK